MSRQNEENNLSSYITDNFEKPTHYYEYLPFGELMVEQNQSTYYNNGYKFNAKELDAATGMYYYGARYYDPSTSIFLSVDPLAEQTMEPYSYVGNNPINFTDPTGMSANPIYDKNGDLLGTDDKGLQGKAIIMDKTNFEQGMKHESAMKHNLGYGGLEDDNARSKFTSSYNSLSSRPDYDGRLTLNEANEWYRNGKGQPLFVDASKINLAPQYRDDFQVGESKYINYASPSNANIESGLVYGTIKLTMLDDKGTTKLGGFGGKLDTYDFDYQKGRVGRNVATWIGSKVAGKGVSYDIFNYGTSTLRNRPVTPAQKPSWSRDPKY